MLSSTFYHVSGSWDRTVSLKVGWKVAPPLRFRRFLMDYREMLCSWFPEDESQVQVPITLFVPLGILGSQWRVRQNITINNNKKVSGYHQPLSVGDSQTLPPAPPWVWHFKCENISSAAGWIALGFVNASYIPLVLTSLAQFNFLVFATMFNHSGSPFTIKDSRSIQKISKIIACTISPIVLITSFLQMYLARPWTLNHEVKNQWF